MALNIKNPEVQKLAGEVARLANETMTEAIRQALIERKSRLRARAARARRESTLEYFERHVWPGVAADKLGKPIPRKEHDKILGYGPHGV